MNPDRPADESNKTGMISLLVLGGGYVLWRVAAFAAGAFVVGGALGSFTSSTELAEIQAGFEEISDEWDVWTEQWDE